MSNKSNICTVIHNFLSLVLLFTLTLKEAEQDTLIKGKQQHGK